MQSFILTSALAFLAGTATAAPTSCIAPVVPNSENTIYEIKDFYSRKPDGKDITALGFNIAATNGSGLHFTCIAYDPVTEQATANFKDGQVYDCGKNSEFAFSYSEEDDFNKGKLYLWQGISPVNTLVGVTDIPAPYCHAGGDGPEDLSCAVPTTAGKITIEMHKP